MNFIIEEFAILSPIEKKAINVEYSEKTNLIVGEKDSGKSTLARAMMYTLGCDVKNFDLIEQYPTTIFVLSFKIESNKYVLLRKKLKSGRGRNYYKVYKNSEIDGVFYNTKDFTIYLNKIMNISVVTVDKKYNETLLYPNHIFLPFFTDQDNSWQNYLRSTFHHLDFIKQYKKLVLEYFIGTRTNDYYELKLEQFKLHNKIEKKSALLESKNLIFEENARNIKIVESIDLKEFKKQYSLMLELYKNIINTEHDLKKKINEKLFLRNSYLEAKEVLNSNINDFENLEIDKKCSSCSQTLENKFKDDYLLYSTRENLLNEREKIEMYLLESEKELKVELEQLNELKQENAQMKNSLNTNGEAVGLAERADSYAFSRINTTLEEEIGELEVELSTSKKEKETVDSKLRNIRDKDLSIKYKELMKKNFDKLSIPFSYKTFYDTNFESVKISLSGTTKVQAYIVQYLTVYELIQKNDSVIKIPMIIDSYIKDHFNEKDSELTTKFIFNTLDKISNQAFIFITDSKQTLDSVDLERVKLLKLSDANNLLSGDYNEVYSMYSQYIEGEFD